MVGSPVATYTLRPVVTLLAADPLAPFSPAVRDWFEASFEAPTQAQAEGWAAIAQGEHTLIHAPTGSGKTLAAFLYALDRLASASEPAARARHAGHGSRPLHLAAQGAHLRRRAQPACAAHRHRPGGPTARRAAADHHGREPDRRHADRGSPRDRPPPAGHPHHDSREPVPAAHEPGPRDPPRRRVRHRRRGPRRSPARSAAPTSP